MIQTQKNAPQMVVHHFKANKINRHDIIYELVNHEPTKFITELVKLERFQGYSKAKNIELYFRLRNESNWSRCEVVTGLFATMDKDVFYGNRKTKSDNKRTLLIFRISKDRRNVEIMEFDHGFYPSRTVIDRLIHSI